MYSKSALKIVFVILFIILSLRFAYSLDSAPGSPLAKNIRSRLYISEDMVSQARNIYTTHFKSGYQEFVTRA